MTHAEQARTLFLEGCNCAQAVLCAYAGELGLSMETAMRLASSFGGGIARLREVCGAISGMCMAAGLRDGYADPRDAEAKKAHYARIRALVGRFEAENGAILCRDLLGAEGQSAGGAPSPRNAAYYESRPCAELVACAARLLEEDVRINPTSAGE